MKTNLKTILSAICLLLGVQLAARCQTYTIVDLGTLGTNGSVATGINNSNQVSGYSQNGTNSARAWRYDTTNGLVDLGSFGGTDSRALGINNAGQVTGYSMDSNGLAHGFIFNNGTLSDIGGTAGGANVFPQHINSAGKVCGFSTDTNGDRPFLFTAANTFSNLGVISNVALPANAAAYGVNDFGRVVGIGTGTNSFNRAFRSGTNGVLGELGTLGGDESWAYAINNSNVIVGSASAITTDTHAFIYTDAASMTDLGTLGGYNSTALALDNSGRVVGTAEDSTRDPHAFLWTAASGMQDLNALIPINSGWKLVEARGVNESGVIVGNGLLNGQPRAFMIKPFSGADTNAPVAKLVASNITSLSYSAQLFQVFFWDNQAVQASSLTTNALRVTGPNGFSQLVTFYSSPPTVDAMKLGVSCYLLPPNGAWNGANNGIYTVSIEPNTVSDTNGNFMPAGAIGSFTVSTETKPVISLNTFFSPIMNQVSNYTLNALGSFPYDTNDVFTFTIDWNNDGSDVQIVSGTTGTQVGHAFNSIGLHTIRFSAVDPHGVSSVDNFTSVFVINPAFPNAWTSAPVLTGTRRLAVGLNSNGTILCLGGLPLKSSKLSVQSLAPGAGLFVDAQRISAQTAGLGAGMDSLNRIVVYGGLEPNSATANVNGYVYSPSTGVGAAIASKHFAVHDFAFCADNLNRLYSISGAVGAGTNTATNAVERYDAVANAWTTLAPLPVNRVFATATYDGRGHILVFGGYDPVAGVFTSTVFSYDIAANAWSQLGDVGAGGAAMAGSVSVLGADGMVYLIGGINNLLTPSAQVLVYDPAQAVWIAGPSLNTPRGTPAVALGNDGFIYVMGGDGPANGGGGGNNNGLSTVEKLDTGSFTAPRIITTPFTTVEATFTFGYQLIATGNPRPVFSLVTAPAGMTLDTNSGFVIWNPTTNQVGTQTVRFRASSAAGVAEQLATITVTPLPGDVTPPTSPTNFFAAFRTSTSITWTWSPATDNVGVVSYNLYNLVGSRSRRWALVASGITNRSFIYNSGFFSSAFAVAAVDAAGNVSPLTTGSAASLTLPFITHIGLGESNTVIQGNSFLYTISATATPFGAFSSLTGPAGMTLTRITSTNPLSDFAVVQWQPNNLQVGTNVFTVFATNANTTGGSATFTVVVLPGGTDLVPPTPVAQMTASGITFDRCNLAWTPAGDNVGVVNYFIKATHFGSPSNQVITLNVPGLSNNCVLGGLLPGAGYTVSITPSDAAGNAGSATSIFLTTLQQPNIVLHLAPGVTPGTMSLNWNGYGTQWQFTVECVNAMNSTNWVPVAPANQWPTSATNVTVPMGASDAQMFFRVKAVPTQP